MRSRQKGEGSWFLGKCLIAAKWEDMMKIETAVRSRQRDKREKLSMPWRCFLTMKNKPRKFLIPRTIVLRKADIEGNGVQMGRQCRLGWGWPVF